MATLGAVPASRPTAKPALQVFSSRARVHSCSNIRPSHVPASSHRHHNLFLVSSRRQATVAAAVKSEVDVAPWVEEARSKRLQQLEEQALDALQKAVDNFEHPAFPCALIAGDVVILHLLHRLGVLSNNKVPVIFIDTFHLFPETHAFLKRLETNYSFQAREFHADGFANKAEYKAKHGSDLYITDIDEYDRICKVEPFNRSLKTLDVDVMINGRRRDHGFERAHLEVFEGGKPVKCNPLAYWEFRDCWDYLQLHKLEAHPLHDEGFPSVGDVHSTIPVPREKWFEYAGERSGRFQGLQNKDGSVKTECGIHVGDDPETGMSNIRK
ncbi:hypothetical protein WJX72_002591 [[Myrmecia] bisecta]|uniref:Phosphoadenosine phosphosulphate reductase domain-containing protein n=1 Tax=[Myrmecia] bisecta TaxID=41462 RepID=A0AAW1QQ85_9CHLO